MIIDIFRNKPAQIEKVCSFFMSLCVVWWQAEEARLRSQFLLEPCDDSHRQTIKLASHWRIAQIAFVNLALLYVLFGRSLDGVGFYFLEPMPYSRFLKFV